MIDPLPDFFNLSYLCAGSKIQQQGYNALEQIRVMHLLKEFTPVLAGTLPLDLFVTGSDLDILCYTRNLHAFKQKTELLFGKQEAFQLGEHAINQTESVVVQFRAAGFEFELFAQPVAVQEQVAYKHLVVEYKLLHQHGLAFKQKILALKQSGIKTEPAFAQALNLPGDPYQALLELKI